MGHFHVLSRGDPTQAGHLPGTERGGRGGVTSPTHTHSQGSTTLLLPASAPVQTSQAGRGYYMAITAQGQSPDLLPGPTQGF